MAKAIYNKQFTIGEILSESWKQFTENFKLILLITLIVYIPLNFVLLLIPFQDTLEGFLSFFRISAKLESLIGIIATMAIAYAIESKINGKSVTVKEALQKSASRMPAAIGTDIVLGILLAIFLILLIVPGIYFGILWSFTSLVVILRNKSFKDAWDYSYHIVKGRWWPVAAYVFVFGLLSLITSFVITIPFWFLPLPENFLIDLISFTLSDVILSYFTVVFIIFFINFDSTKQTIKENPKQKTATDKAPKISKTKK